MTLVVEKFRWQVRTTETTVLRLHAVPPFQWLRFAPIYAPVIGYEDPWIIERERGGEGRNSYFIKVNVMWKKSIRGSLYMKYTYIHVWNYNVQCICYSEGNRNCQVKRNKYQPGKFIQNLNLPLHIIRFARAWEIFLSRAHCEKCENSPRGALTSGLLVPVVLTSGLLVPVVPAPEFYSPNCSA